MGRALILLAVAALACIAAVAQGYQSDRVLLQDVRTLTLRSGQYTTGRRSAPVPQIKCIGGSAGCNAADIRVMQCNQQYNEQWECKADLPNEVSFGETTVVCEGYDNPNDPYILVGSCGVEYTLEGRPQHNRQHSYSGDHHYNNYSNQSRSGSSLWSLIVFAFLAFFVYRICFAGPSTPGAPGGAPGRTGWGGGGGGWGGWGGGGGGGGGNTYPPGCAPSSGTGTGGPGFWTGLGVGGILGNLFARPAGGYRPGYATNYGGGFGGGGFGGGGFGGAMGGGGGGGGGTRTASGFGGTRRR